MTPLPNIPTDNLYKFTFIAGLTTMLTAFVLFVTQYNSIITSIDKLEFEAGKIESESDYLMKEAIELRKNLEAINNKIGPFKADSFNINTYIDDRKSKLLNDKNYREYLSFVFTHKSDLVPYSEELSKLRKTNETIQANNKQIILNKDITILKFKQIKKEFTRLIIASILLCLMIYIGYRIAKSGYYKWYILVQQPSDEKSMLELLELKKKHE